MRATTKQQPMKAVTAPTPSKSEGTQAPTHTQMTEVIAALSELRNRYLGELKSARQTAKKNFLA
jgi:hypothetical protein